MGMAPDISLLRYISLTTSYFTLAASLAKMVRLRIIRNARIEDVGTSQSCMVSKVRTLSGRASGGCLAPLAILPRADAIVNALALADVLSGQDLRRRRSDAVLRLLCGVGGDDAHLQHMGAEEEAVGHKRTLVLHRADCTRRPSGVHGASPSARMADLNMAPNFHTCMVLSVGVHQVLKSASPKAAPLPFFLCR